MEPWPALPFLPPTWCLLQYSRCCPALVLMLAHLHHALPRHPRQEPLLEPPPTPDRKQHPHQRPPLPFLEPRPDAQYQFIRLTPLPLFVLYFCNAHVASRDLSSNSAHHVRLPCRVHPAALPSSESQPTCSVYRRAARILVIQRRLACTRVGRLVNRPILEGPHISHPC